MNQDKFKVVKQEMARLNNNILGISELKWIGMVKFNSDDHYIYYCGQESLRRNGVALIVNKRVQNAVEWSEVTQSCPTLCNPMDCSIPGSSVHGIFPGKGTGVGCHFLLQRIFLTQGSNPGLPHCREMLYHLSQQGIECNLKNDRMISVHFIQYHSNPSLGPNH